MRTIEIKGVGSSKSPVDYIVLTLGLRTLHLNYDIAMEKAAEKADKLSNSLVSIGFEKEALKTLDFQISTTEKCRKDANGNNEWYFAGYVVAQDLKLEFDFDSKRLGQVLSTVSICGAEPKIDIDFTVKDQEAVKAELLRSATKNAREKAEILCMASGVELGELLAINYNWGEIRLQSNTRIRREMEIPSFIPGGASIDMTPEDVSASDTVTFIWEIR